VKKQETPQFDDTDSSVESFERQMRMENLKTGDKKKRDYSKYIIAGAIIAALLVAVRWLENFGFFELVAIAVVVAGFYLYMQRKESAKDENVEERKHTMLQFKYRVDANLRKLQKGIVWKGESAEQLVDSLGAPKSIKPFKGRDTSNAVWEFDGRVGFESGDGKKKLVYEEGLFVELKEGIVAAWKSRQTPLRSGEPGAGL